MALVANDLKTQMMSATTGATEPAAALSALGTAITNYLLANAEIDFTWDGQKATPPTQDPVTTAHGGITQLSITLTPSGATSYPGGINYMANEITVDFRAGKYNITDLGFSTSEQTMTDAPALSISMSQETDRGAAFGNLANQIVNWVKSYKPTGIILGGHAPYSAPPGTGGTPSTTFY